VHDVNGAGQLALGNFYRKNVFSEKAFCFKTEIKISTFQDARHNLNGATDMSYSKFTPDYVYMVNWLSLLVA